jgi:predicted MFS family arabinose efflux permease
MAAAPLVAVLVLNADVASVSILQIAQTLPYLLFSIPAGVLADRMSRKLIMQGGELLRGASLLLIPVIGIANWLNLPLLVFATLIGTMGAVAYSVAVPSLVPSLVSKESLAAANSNIELARSTAYIGGPALAGALVAWTGTNPAFALAACLSFVAVWLISGLAEPKVAPREDQDFRAELREATCFVWGHELLRPLLIITVIFNIGFFILQTAYIPFAAHVLKLSSTEIGLTLAAYGVGMAVAALAAARISRRLCSGMVLMSGLGLSTAGCAIMLLTFWLPSFWLAAGCYFLMGVGPVLSTVSSSTLRQTVTPANLLGRVSAINTMAVYGARPLGALIAGAVAGALSMQMCLWIAMAAFLIQLVLFFRSPLPFHGDGRASAGA